MKLLITGLLAILSLSAIAKEGGNGGDGIIIGKNIYLLDFVEAGVEEDPYINPNVEVNPKILARIEKSLFISALPQRLVAAKLSEIEKISPVTAISLMKAIEMYTFRFVSTELVNIRDEDTSLQYDPEKLIQLAVRKDRSILIDRLNWLKLSPKNQAGLIFHEMIYAMVPTVKDGDRSYSQPSYDARQLTGYLFHQELTIKGFEGLKHISRNGAVLPIDERSVQETAQGICIAKGLTIFTPHYVNLTPTISGRIIETLNPNATSEEIEKTAEKFCSEYKAAIVRGHIEKLLTTPEGPKVWIDEVRTIYTCARNTTLNFEEYKQSYTDEVGNIYFNTKSRLNHATNNDLPEFPGSLEQTWKHGMVATSKNVGTLFKPRVQWEIDYSPCLRKFEDAIEDYSK